MNYSPIGWTALASLALASLSACNSADEPSSDATSAASQAVASAPDPCSLVTADEVTAVIGEKVVRARAEGETCTYETEDAMASSVTVQIKPKGAAAEMASVREASKLLGDIGKQMEGAGGAQGDVSQAISSKQGSSGLGDESVFDANSALHLRKGESYIMVTPPTMRSRMSAGNPMLSKQQRQEMAVAIAQKALSKI